MAYAPTSQVTAGDTRQASAPMAKLPAKANQTAMTSRLLWTMPANCGHSGREIGAETSRNAVPTPIANFQPFPCITRFACLLLFPQGTVEYRYPPCCPAAGRLSVVRHVDDT